MEAQPAQPTCYAQTFDEHVHTMVQDALVRHNESVTASHMQWLHRQFARVLVRTLELDRREAELVQRERALARPRKYFTGKNHGGRGGQSVHASRPAASDA